MNIQKREQVLNTAMMLFNEYGFHATPTSKIASETKVSVGTLFNYFPNKEDLINSIYLHIKLHSRATFLELLEEQNNTHDTLLSMWHSIIKWGIEFPEEFKFLELYCHSPYSNLHNGEKALEVYKQFQIQILKLVIPTAICDTYPDYILNYIDYSLHAATKYILLHKIENQEDFIKSAFELVWLGLSYHEKK